MITRRGILAMMAGAALDPDRLLWRPGAKLISIPAAPKVWAAEWHWSGWVLTAPSGRKHWLPSRLPSDPPRHQAIRAFSESVLNADVGKCPLVFPEIQRLKTALGLDEMSDPHTPNRFRWEDGQLELTQIGRVEAQKA